MGTTIWVDDATRKDLRNLQKELGARSVNAAIRRLLERPVDDAAILFSRHRRQIKAILQRHGLSNVVAFGSRARGDARRGSDLDLSARVRKGGNPLAVLAAEADLEELLGVHVRIVTNPSPELAAEIRREGVRFEG